GLEAHVYFEAAAVIIAFILLGKLLEERAKGNTSSAIKKLMGLQPKNVVVMLPDGTEKQIAIEDVRLDNIILVMHCEQIPVDGIVTSGTYYVHESMLSCEPISDEKRANALLSARNINQKGSFQFKANNVCNDNKLAQIIKMVQVA